MTLLNLYSNSVKADYIKKNSIAQKAPVKITTFEVLVNHASGLMLSSSSTFIIRL